MDHPASLAGARALVVGLGRHGGGVVAARWLADQGARVTITDRAAAEALSDSIAALADCSIERWRLGGHDEADVQSADLLVVNPAVRPDHPLVVAARRRGVRIASELELFLERCPARVSAVTGSNGKSTTSALLASALAADGRAVWLGGNIGRSLLPELARMSRGDEVVLEVSSFQLHWLPDNFPAPAVAAITNLTPNHLDWHGAMAKYAQAKRRLVAGQDRNDVAVFAADPPLDGWLPDLRGRHARPWPLGDVPELRLLGVHNRQNAALAAAAAESAGAQRSRIVRALSEFDGLPHRLKLVRTIDGRRFYNDSMATSPESVIAALETLTGRVWLLAGGYDKGCDYTALGRVISRHARGAAFFGRARRVLDAAVDRCAAPPPTTSVETLDEALVWCWRRSSPGDAIALSPACASYDQFRDYRDRAARFIALVDDLLRARGCARSNTAPTLA